MATKTQVSGYKASAQYQIISPFKVRRVANEVRRRPYTEAVAILENLPQRGAKMIKKVVESAAANALYANKNLDEDMLYIKELRVDEGPRLRRVWFRARGRADLIHKRMSHITAVVDQVKATGA